jgi:2-polyprenyl-3-methyl-5-hydroxy-6-metoxy-1,4-benzoquinol methylase
VAALVERWAPERRSDAALLDVGCGYGHLLARFRDHFELYGVELSEHAVEEAQRRLPRAHVLRADLQEGLPFRGRFDVVLAINVVEHLEDPQAGVAALAGALRQGGVAVIHLPTINGPVSRGIYRFAYAADPTHIYRPSSREVVGLFGSERFQLLEGSHAPHSKWMLSGLRWHPAYLAAFRLG